MSLKVRLAAPGDGAAVRRLGEIALAGHETESSLVELGAAVDADGGRLRVPYGLAHVLVACVEGEDPSGLLFITPPVELIKNCSGDFTLEQQEGLGRMLAEVQLLGVDATSRGRGVASRLWQYAEVMLRQRGCSLALVKIRRDERVVAWYRRQGFHVLKDGQPFVLKVGGMRIGISDDPDDFHCGLKVLA